MSHELFWAIFLCAQTGILFFRIFWLGPCLVNHSLDFNVLCKKVIFVYMTCGISVINYFCFLERAQRSHAWIFQVFDFDVLLCFHERKGKLWISCLLVEDSELHLYSFCNRVKLLQVFPCVWDRDSNAIF